jgi:glutathione S-transferase
MPLRVHLPPLSSFCWKVQIGLNENDTPFEPVTIDFGDPASRDAFQALWPLAKIPLLEDTDRGEIVPETSIVFDYLDTYYPGPLRYNAGDPDQVWRTRMWDRVFDHHVHHHMQKIVGDRIRPAGRKDPYGVEESRAKLTLAYGLVEAEAGRRTWFSGEAFGRADCSAFPALYYANRVQPLGDQYPAIGAYMERLAARPSVRRVLSEAEPFFKFFPEG